MLMSLSVFIFCAKIKVIFDYDIFMQYIEIQKLYQFRPTVHLTASYTSAAARSCLVPYKHTLGPSTSTS